MLTDLRVRSAMLAAIGAAAISSARADSAPATRPVIRGTGSDVQVVYEGPPKPPRLGRAIAFDPVAEALRQKASGASDESVVEYLRQHQAELPPTIDTGVVREFRKAGAGDSVTGFLSSHLALDIGVTAESAERSGGSAPGEALSPNGAYSDLAGSGYPFYGPGYAYGYGGPGLAMGGIRGGKLGPRFRFPGRVPLLPSRAFEFFRQQPKARPLPSNPGRPHMSVGRPRMP